MKRAACEVLIVGAGPAGCAAGIELARAGVRVLVVDRAVFPRPKTCGDAISNRAVRIIGELGAAIELDAAPHAIVRGSAAVLPDGTRISRSYGSSPARIVGRLDLDDVLRRALERSGATLLQGCHLRSLVLDDDRVCGASGDDLRVFANVVIAADGPGSIAWTSLGETAPRGASLAVSATAYYEGMAPLPEDGVSEHYFEKDLAAGYGWIFPPVAGISNIGVYQRADAYRTSHVPLREALERFRGRHHDRFASAKRVGEVRTWSLPLGGAIRRPARAGLLACGDAGRYVDPLTGEGIFQALHTGRLAAAFALKGLSKGDVDVATVRRFQLAAATSIDFPCFVRSGIQDAMSMIVERDAYRSKLVRALLTWGFGSGSLELTKDVG